MKRNIVKIDEAKCNGCGLCTKACAEGAIAMIDGKAKLVKDIYCDGLGACLGKCPVDAITIEVRDAEAFDEAAVHQHLAKQQAPAAAPKPAAAPHHGHAGCPGSMARAFAAPAAAEYAVTGDFAAAPSELRQWPVQLHLVPVRAPYFAGADLLIAADCVPFAYAGFHAALLKGKRLLIGCPKLDDTEAYQEKLQAIFEQNDIASVTVAHMEVPCCFGLLQVVKTALANCGKNIPLSVKVIGIQGDCKS
jgi:Pyruvate/2-oxoacid:ferredoxin oxidoreductase delta subunit